MKCLKASSKNIVDKVGSQGVALLDKTKELQNL